MQYFWLWKKTPTDHQNSVDKKPDGIKIPASTTFSSLKMIKYKIEFNSDSS